MPGDIFTIKGLMNDKQTHFDVIVIGGGPAGVTAALRACELGASAALVEKGELGGTCTNDGCVPTRVLAKAARLLRDSEQYADYGLIGERPEVDFGRLINRTQQIIYRVHEKKQLLGHLTNSGVTVYAASGPASFVDANRLRLGSGDVISAEKFIICAGGHARKPDFPGSEHALTHSDIWSLRELPKRVAIVGAAATGCQLASVLNDFGAEVTLLEAADRILAGNDEAISAEMTAAFTESGITIISGTGFDARLEPIADGYRYHFSVDSQPQRIEIDALILAIGWPGNADTLSLGAAGVTFERSYIPVNDYLQTNQPHIYAAGDITGHMMLVQAGQDEARIAAENALGELQQSHAHKIVPNGSFTDPEYASVGPTEVEARKAGPIAVAMVPYAALDRAVIDGYTRGMCKLIVSATSTGSGQADTHKILAAHVVGEQAVETIQLVAAGMQAGMHVERLAALEIAYPTYAAIVGIAARKLVRDLGIEPLAAQWRNLNTLHIAEWERSSDSATR